jgi:hypothetical protein
MTMFHDKITIGGKDVYIVESHQSVLEPWAEICRSLPTAPALLTLDHHTDTNAPFNNYRFRTAGASRTDQAIAQKEALLPEMIAALRYEDEASVQKAIVLLKNDEHITTALEAGILSQAFVRRGFVLVKPCDSDGKGRLAPSTVECCDTKRRGGRCRTTRREKGHGGRTVSS